LVSHFRNQVGDSHKIHRTKRSLELILGLGTAEGLAVIDAVVELQDVVAAYLEEKQYENVLKKSEEKRIGVP
jgi:hypothetical protein